MSRGSRCGTVEPRSAALPQRISFRYGNNTENSKYYLFLLMSLRSGKTHTEQRYDNNTKNSKSYFVFMLKRSGKNPHRTKIR